MIDLHFHSTKSDGTIAPRELALLGKEQGLSAMVLTDHDTLSGAEEFINAATELGIRAISGVELSADVPGKTVHLLGYGVDINNKPLNEALEKIRNGRKIRNNEILAKLTKYGCFITMNEVAEFAGDKDLIARPHFAAALIKKGYASSKNDAFARYLGRGGIAYADRYRLSPAEAINLIHAAGGVVSLAHPYQIGYSTYELHDFIEKLVNLGLDGIETYYSHHSFDMLNDYKAQCYKHNIIPTGGSDFHGENSTNIKLGVGTGSLNVPDSSFDSILDRINLRKKYTSYLSENY